MTSPNSCVQPAYKIFPETGDRFRVKIFSPSFSRVRSPVNFTEPASGTCGVNGDSVVVALQEMSNEAQVVIRCICGEFHGSKVTVSGGTLVCHVVGGQLYKAIQRTTQELRKIATRHHTATV